MLSLLPKPISAFLRSFRRSFRGKLDRLCFPFWLLFQCAIHRRKAVVLWRTAALGDIVCTLPMCREIRKRHPDRLFIYMTLRRFKNVVLLSREVDLVYAIDHVYGTPSWKLLVDRRLSAFIEKVYEPLTTEEHLDSGIKLHLVEDLAGSCGFTLSDSQPRLFPSAEMIKKVQSAYGLSGDLARGRLLIGINGGHTWPVREWDATKWQKIVDMIHAEYDAVILQFGLNLGPGIPDEYDQLKGVRSLVSQLALEDMVALIASCHLIVSIDSGPVHVAGAVGTPVVGLFGAVNPLYRLPPASLSVGVVSDVPCLFCQHQTPVGHWMTGCPHEIRCMKQLEVQPVMQAIRAMLSKRERVYACKSSGNLPST